MRRIFLFNFIALAALVACRPASVIPEPDPGTNIPNPPGEEETVSIAFLKTLYNGAPVRIEGEYRISGAVVSSDVEGNFYHTLVLDDGTGGIEVKLDMERIFEKFWYHTRATVRCNGLWLGSYGGTIQLGTEPWDDFQTRPLSEIEIAEHLISDKTFVGEVLPLALRFSELSIRYISTYVAFEDVAFIDDEAGLSWADTEKDTDTGADPDPDPDTSSGTDRHIIDAAGDTLIVRTSRVADFATRQLPSGKGRIEGVLGYFNGKYQITLSHYSDFMKY